MSYEESIIISAYTGVLMCAYEDMHKYIEEKLGRAVWTHELTDEKVLEEIKEKTKEDFLKICQEANNNKGAYNNGK